MYYFIIILVVSAMVFSGPIEDLKPGEWYEVPNSHLRQVAPNPEPPSQNSTGVKGVIGNWSGGAFDTYRDRLIVWGGGHFAYSGNEIYCFDLNTLQWERVNDPSHYPDYNYEALGWVNGEDECYPDGRPVSRHTYDALTYLPPPVDRFFSNGGSALYSQSFGDTTTWMYDFETDTWEAKVKVVDGGFGNMTEYDPVTGHVFMQGAGSGNKSLREYDPALDQWKTHANPGWGYDGSASGAIDPKRHIMVTTRGGRPDNSPCWFDLDQASIERQTYSGGGPQDVRSAGNPGFVYDPVSDKFVGWDGGANVYTLDWDTKTWARVSPAASNTITPTAAVSNGTYDRFAYSPKKNVFIVVNSVDENVFIYKLTSDASAPQWYLDMINQGTNSVSYSLSKNDIPVLYALPNPFHSSVTLQLNQASGIEFSGIKIYDIKGALVQTFSGKLSQKYFWNTARLSPGTYLARVMARKKQITRKLFLIK